MFDKIYNKSISKVKPDEKLIENTKKMMIEELKLERKKPSIMLYKYATVAACIVVVVSVFSIKSINIIDNSVPRVEGNKVSSGKYEEMDSIDRTQSLDSSISDEKIPNAYSQYNSFSSVTASDSLGVTSTIKNVNDNVFTRWIKKIIQWFYELLF